MGDCPDSFYFTKDNDEWIGYGYLNFNTTPLNDLNNISISVIFETIDFEDKSYLGEIDRVPVWHNGISAKNEASFKIKFPLKTPLPNIVEIKIDGNELCSNAVQKEDTILIHLRYDILTSGSSNFSEIYDRSKIVSYEIDKLIAEIFGPSPETNPSTTESLITSTNVPHVPTCGRINTAKSAVPLVLNGEAYPRGAWPWLVSVFSYDGHKLGFRCGGTLISSTLAVTAAHCFYNQFNRMLPIDDITIVLGQHNIRRYDADTKIIYPKSFNIHPNYRKRGSADSDIAVIVFPDSVTFTKYIQPACLWESTEKLDGQNGVVAGWGRDENGNAFTALPKKLEIPVVSDATCLRSHQAFQMITTEQTFCGGWRNGSYSPCNGDSGGGLLIDKEDKWFLKGIVSTSLSKQQICDPNEYVVFVDVVPFVDWILSFSDKPNLL
ncbi:Peptidase S1 domain-containing protein [Sergentomyia squamirostris]